MVRCGLFRPINCRATSLAIVYAIGVTLKNIGQYIWWMNPLRTLILATDYKVPSNHVHRPISWDVLCYWVTWAVVWLRLWPQTARFLGPTWGSPGDDRTQVGPMLATWTLLLGTAWLSCHLQLQCNKYIDRFLLKQMILCHIKVKCRSIKFTFWDYKLFVKWAPGRRWWRANPVAAVTRIFQKN